MVGGSGRNDGIPAISSSNIFAALESRKKKSSKRKSDKASGESLKEEATVQPAQFWAPTQVAVKSWADCDDDDDDYFATTAPPPVFTSALSEEAGDGSEQKAGESQLDDSEGEDEGEDELEDDGEDEAEGGLESNEGHDSAVAASMETKVVQPASAPSERQLSKKEIKKKELAELDAVLAELGLAPESVEEDASSQHNGTCANGAVQDKECKQPTAALADSKSAKRKKKKDKAKEAKDGAEDSPALPEEMAGKAEPDASAPDSADSDSVGLLDPSRLKKLASLKKSQKKSKDGDSGAKAVAAEAAARAARLAAAKKKEKAHYNQQPVR